MHRLKQKEKDGRSLTEKAGHTLRKHKHTQGGGGRALVWPDGGATHRSDGTLRSKNQMKERTAAGEGRLLL